MLLASKRRLTKRRSSRSVTLAERSARPRIEASANARTRRGPEARRVRRLAGCDDHSATRSIDEHRASWSAPSTRSPAACGTSTSSPSRPARTDPRHRPRQVCTHRTANRRPSQPRPPVDRRREPTARSREAAALSQASVHETSPRNPSSPTPQILAGLD
jgi:hypothetical protein